jgi:hypothetical protein
MLQNLFVTPTAIAGVIFSVLSVLQKLWNTKYDSQAAPGNGPYSTGLRDKLSLKRSGAVQDCHLVEAGGCSLTVGTVESSMSKAGLDNRHRNHDGEISHKHGNTTVHTLRKIYGQSFAAGHPETKTLSEVLLQLNETSLGQLRRDHETGHLKHKIAKASK